MTKQAPKLAVLILMMEKQWPATQLTLTSVVRVLPENAEVVLLLNGGEHPDEIREKVGVGFPNVRFYHAPENLGVAGGRNFLLDTDEAQHAEIIFILDNDVLVPDNYFADTLAFLDAHPDCGVVGALVFRAHPEVLLLFEESRNNPDADDLNLAFGSQSLIGHYLEKGTPEPFWFGMNENWKRVYFSTLEDIRQKFSMLFGMQPGFFINHDRNPDVLHRIRSGDAEIPTSNVSGCCMAYRRALLDKVGYYYEGFHPYGSEDRAFSIQAMKNGYTNYVNPRVAMFHGFDERQSTTEDFKSMKQLIKMDVLLRLVVLDGKLERFLSVSAYSAYALLRRGLRAIQRGKSEIFWETVEAIREAFDTYRRNKPEETR